MTRVSLIKTARDERGQTAILSVIFFTILMMVLTVSFMRVVTAEQVQTTNNELEASAMAAAESGIQDAQRVLTYCYSLLPTMGEACERATGYTATTQRTTCDYAVPTSVLGESGAPLGNSTNTTEDNPQVQVGASGNEYYTCMIINVNTPNVEYAPLNVANGTSQIIPLKFVNNDVTRIQINWHKGGDSDSGGDGGYKLSDGSDLPAYSQWSGPAVLRVEVAKVPKAGNFSIDDLTANARAVTLRPTTGGINNTVYSMDTWAPTTSPNTATAPLLASKCTDAISSGAYACRFNFNMGTFDWANNDYYLRIQEIYRGSTIQVMGLNSSGNPVYFQGVQPSVDITGRTADSYKRLKALLNPQITTIDIPSGVDSWYPEYAVDTGGKVCKNLSVTVDSGNDLCTH